MRLHLLRALSRYNFNYLIYVFVRPVHRNTELSHAKGVRRDTFPSLICLPQAGLATISGLCPFCMKLLPPHTHRGRQPLLYVVDILH